MRDRISLSTYDETFLDLSFDWLTDPETKALTMTPHLTREGQHEFFQSLSDRPDYHIWGLRFEGRAIGAAGIKNVRGSRGEYWGYIGDKTLWGQRLGREIITLLEGEAKRLGLHTLYLKVATSNKRAQSLYRRMDYVTESEQDGVVFMVKELDR